MYIIEVESTGFANRLNGRRNRSKSLPDFSYELMGGWRYHLLKWRKLQKEQFQVG